MNNYFINITKNLNLKPFHKNKVDIDMFKNHISIKRNMKPFRILFLIISIQRSIQRSCKKRNTQPKR